MRWLEVLNILSTFVHLVGVDLSILINKTAYRKLLPLLAALFPLKKRKEEPHLPPLYQFSSKVELTWYRSIFAPAGGIDDRQDNKQVLGQAHTLRALSLCPGGE